MTKTRKILTFCATQVSMIALMFGFGGNQQAQGPYAKLFNNALGVKDAEAAYGACDEICVAGGFGTAYCSYAQSDPYAGNWCTDYGAYCIDGTNEACLPNNDDDDDDDES